MDTSIKPCYNFYHFACGNFIKKSIIREEYSVNNSFTQILDQVYKELGVALENKLVLGDPEVLKKLKA